MFDVIVALVCPIIGMVLFKYLEPHLPDGNTLISILKKVLIHSFILVMGIGVPILVIVAKWNGKVNDIGVDKEFVLVVSCMVCFIFNTFSDYIKYLIK